MQNVSNTSVPNLFERNVMSEQLQIAIVGAGSALRSSPPELRLN
jgi:hypothetical protein